MENVKNRSEDPGVISDGTSRVQAEGFDFSITLLRVHKFYVIQQTQKAVPIAETQFRASMSCYISCEIAITERQKKYISGHHLTSYQLGNLLLPTVFRRLSDIKRRNVEQKYFLTFVLKN